MNTIKIDKHIKNLKRLKGIIEISKFDTINKLKNVQKTKNNTMERAMICRNLLETGIKKFHLSHSIDPVKKVGDIFIYITLPLSLMDTSNAKYEKIILKEFNRETDEIILIGEPAIEFGRKNYFNPIYMNESLDNEAFAISSIVSRINLGQKKYGVKIVASSSLIGKTSLTIYPLEEFEVEEKGPNVDYSVLKYESNPLALIDRLAFTYLYNIIYGLIKDIHYFYLKEKLAKHEASLDSVDSKIELETRKLRKTKRNAETEEMILISQVAQRSKNE